MKLTRLILKVDGLVVSVVSLGCCRLGVFASSVNAASAEEGSRWFLVSFLPELTEVW